MTEEPQLQKKIKGKRSAKKNGPRTEKTKYAYTIKDKTFGELNVLRSANAWWNDRAKVERLIEVYKLDASNEEACFYAGISSEQLKYFMEQHREFYAIKEQLKQMPILKARKTINDALETDLGNAWKYLSRKRKVEFGANIDLTSGGEKLPAGGNQIAFVDFKEHDDAEDT